MTGATSLLGRATVSQLLERGDDVTCLQRSSTGLDVREVRCDVRDREAVLDAARGHDAIIHLAALVAPKPRYRDAFDVNVTGTGNVLEAARGCGRLVHVSSPSVAFAGAAVFGEGVGAPAYSGGDAYTATKAIAERLVLHDGRTPAVVIRPHLVWGPGDTQLVGRIVERARAKRLRLPDHGRALIDTTYVDDAGRALVAAHDHARDGDPATGRAWVVTGNDPRPVAEVVEGILRAAGVREPAPSVPAPVASVLGRLADRFGRSDEPAITYFAARQLSLSHWFDQREVQRVLGWQPRFSVDAGMAQLTRWYARRVG